MAELANDEIEALIAGATVASRFRDSVRAHPDRLALRSWDGDTPVDLTWAEYAERACRLAASLGRLGIARGDRVVLMMRNRPEFHVADMAVLLCGATPISIYFSSAPDQIAYLANHSRARVAIVEHEHFLTEVLSVRGEIPTLEHVAVIDEPATIPADVLRWADLLTADPVDLDAAASIAQPDDLATVIYTSGTTGPPKGVMLDHHGVLWTATSLVDRFGFDVTGMRLVSYLPMAHIAERMTSHYAGILHAYEVTTCPDAGRIAQWLTKARPEIFFAVPRVWEKAYATVSSLVHADPAQGAAFDAAIDLGWEVSEYHARGEEPPADLAARHAEVDATVLAPWRGILGLDACRVAISGAAPIPFEILRFFRGLGIPLSEIYGLSETYGPMTWTPFRVKVGTVGPAIPATEVRLGDDGEVLCRGGNIFRGYLDDPERTAEVMSGEWFHTGDIGVLDEDGYLRIVDRKKELIITAGGKNISPANIEAALKASPLVGQACVIGDARPYLTALLVLDPEVAPVWAAGHGIAEADLAGLAANPEVLAAVQADVDAVNARFSQVEGIKRFRLLSDEWMPDSEELTPTMKLKRRGINSRYAAEIEALYS
ncbi:MAG: AMP-dependent synthetase/ligase [Actinomycetes bacterium]